MKMTTRAASKPKVRAAAKRLKKMSDSDINYADIPPITDEFFYDCEDHQSETKKTENSDADKGQAI